MLDGATGCRGLIAFHSTSPDGVTPMPPAPITLADLFQTGAGLIGPAWMPVYDLAAYLTAADQATGWSSDMMAARELDRLRLAEYQAIVDLCAAFQPAGFDGGSHYQRVDPSDARLTAVLADNAADPQPLCALAVAPDRKRRIGAARGRVSLTVCAPPCPTSRATSCAASCPRFPGTR